jgi:hypothetical protein
MSEHTAVRKYTDKDLLEGSMLVEGFKGFPKGRFIIGVRSQEDTSNVYDDKFYEYENIGEEFTMDPSKMLFIRVLTGTTNPGIKILKGGFKSFNPKGAAVLKSNMWYYNVWKYGMHRGKMPALRQRGAEVIVYRDGDMDGKSEELGEPISGWYGINYHMNTYDFSDANLDKTIWTIGGWSAGCQVTNEREEYLDQMEWYEDALNSGKQKFVTYCLLREF